VVDSFLKGRLPRRATQHSAIPPAGNRIVATHCSDSVPNSPLDTRRLNGQFVMKQFITTGNNRKFKPNNTMQTLTVRDLRYDFGQVEAWLAFGEVIEITKHGKPVAHLSLPNSGTIPKFDVEAHRKRMKETWGDRVFSAEEVREMREAELGDQS
jgi:antitoxin (DNA-binding transcriptional repressor) of toxin-antitoxin stability system